MRHTPPTAQRAGFTLVEVLLTLLIVSGLMMTMTNVLQVARQSRDTIHNIQENQLAGPAILDLIERDLRAIHTFNTPVTHQLRVTDRVLGGNDADSINFPCTTPSLLPLRDGDATLRAMVNEVGYVLRPNPEEADFLEVYRREGFGVDAAPFEEGHYIFLHDRVKGLDIAIFSEDGPDAEPLTEWGAESTEEQGLPARVEITLTLELRPRLTREALLHPSLERQTMVYRRIFRFPETLRGPDEEAAVLVIPTPPASSGEPDPSAGASSGETDDIQEISTDDGILDGGKGSGDR